jgi:hypothetical protein
LPSASFHHHNHHIKSQQEKNHYQDKDCFFHYLLCGGQSSKGQSKEQYFLFRTLSSRLENFQNADNHKIFSIAVSKPKSIYFVYLFEEAKLSEKEPFFGTANL